MLVKNFEKFETIKAEHETKLAELAERDIDTLTANEMAFLKCVGHGSIKQAQKIVNGVPTVSNLEVLKKVGSGTRTSPVNSASVTKFLASMTAEERAKFLVSFGG